MPQEDPQPSHSQELAWITASQSDARAFAPLYERYFVLIFRFIHRRCGHRELAADLTQQTFLKALLALSRYQFRDLPFRAWLYRIALNELRMYWRKRKEVTMELSFAEVRGLVQEIGMDEREEEMRRLSAVLGRLSEQQSRLIDLRFFDRLSYAEMGQVLGIGEDAAKMRTHRVLALLRNYLVRKA